MRWGAVLSAVAALLAACSSPQATPASADPTTVQDADGVISRFTNDIFPGATAWSYVGGQDGNEANAIGQWWISRRPQICIPR